jgi:hypothetical protein
LVLKADWLVDTANARWDSQNPGHWGDVWFEHADRNTGLPGCSIQVQPSAGRPEPGLAHRLLVFIRRNQDILDMRFVRPEVLEALCSRAKVLPRWCSCETCSSSARQLVAVERSRQSEALLADLLLLREQAATPATNE